MIDTLWLASAFGATAANAAKYADVFDVLRDEYEINTRRRLAHFIAQVGHESGSLLYTREIWGPTATQAKYEGRKDLGNTRQGDGALFRGRGLIQITGRFNYATMYQRLRDRFGNDVPNFEEQPHLLEEPRWAALSAGEFWHWKQLNKLADSDDVTAVTRRINGGTNGLADRRRRLKVAEREVARLPESLFSSP